MEPSGGGTCPWAEGPEGLEEGPFNLWFSINTDEACACGDKAGWIINFCIDKEKGKTSFVALCAECWRHFLMLSNRAWLRLRGGNVKNVDLVPVPSTIAGPLVAGKKGSYYETVFDGEDE